MGQRVIPICGALYAIPITDVLELSVLTSETRCILQLPHNNLHKRLLWRRVLIRPSKGVKVHEDKGRWKHSFLVFRFCTEYQNYKQNSREEYQCQDKKKLNLTDISAAQTLHKPQKTLLSAASAQPRSRMARCYSLRVPRIQ
ncbi:hypothetical protein XU18_3612 [Perkinsela sp. CCAP 1560/4]|nr:hypothetical protein XU18_3612 [Perkinsela sp. CCAP 1560/4]|eukprot:KNH05372.1 hypothetical protein XU18_3612 [Perkinsela sp. CCAP 1560/4]